MSFKLVSKFKPAGDQPQAIEKISKNILKEIRHQVLLGVTGSGKTYTMAEVIARINKPALVISPNKTLAAQLYAEFKQFFPENAVEYFISYYDYYQPEAYLPQTDTYIEKDASINAHIERLRLRATSSLLERNDIIVVASVSCIYGLGSPNEYKGLCVSAEKGQFKERQRLLQELVAIQYDRNDTEFAQGKFRVRGDTVEIFPAYLETALRIKFFGDQIEEISEIHPLDGKKLNDKEKVFVYPAKHFVVSPASLEQAFASIEKELTARLAELKTQGKLLEAQRLEMRTRYDLEMLREIGYCAGIENYSRHLSGRQPGERPGCLLDYFPENHLIIIDESHITVPQIGGMYQGDRARKQTLVDYGFRLPSALDNRPLKFAEFENLVPQVVYVSATPGPYELAKTKQAGVKIVEQIIRPTGLIDPQVVIKPTANQIDDLIEEITERVKHKERVLVTTLTKRMSEDLSAYLEEKGLLVRYLHSEIDSLQRIEILGDLRRGKFDCLVGINLLREGLDLPEVSLVAVLDADKEGFLRSDTSLIQICGRAARHLNGKVILYADSVTGSMRRAIDEMQRRRKKQVAYNEKNHIVPRSIKKAVEQLEEFTREAKKESLTLIREDGLEYAAKQNLPQLIKQLETEMDTAAANLDFELAAALRDKLFALQEMAPKKLFSVKVRKNLKEGR
ncbi:MAG: excinuclease ABC subunit UvrB [Elusimicrobiota bacterium]